MTALAAHLLAALTQAQNTATAVVLVLLGALGVRALTLVVARRGEGALFALARVLGALGFLGGGTLYALFTLPVLSWDAPALVGGALAALAVSLWTAWSLRARPASRGLRALPRPTHALAQLALLLALLLSAALTLMRAGFLSLTTDRPVLLVDVTGETALERVRWAAPGEPLREEPLTTHRVVMRTPAGEPVADLWLYGDQVAVKGRVLRLSPLLAAAGVPNLFELQFVHNGWATLERHNAYPHVARPLTPVGPLAVHPWWRGVQRRLLERLERDAVDDSAWGVRALSTESTFFALVAQGGAPARRTYRLVLTPGGLTEG